MDYDELELEVQVEKIHTGFSLSPEEYQKSVSPLSTERDSDDCCTRETPSPSCELQESGSPWTNESSSSPTPDQSSRLTKGEKLAREEGIDKFISNDDIINMDLKELKEELVRFMTEEGMTQRQYEVCKEIRKKGKNNEKAKECRLRKEKELASLKTKVKEKRKLTDENLRTLQKLRKIKSDWQNQLDHLMLLTLQLQNKDPAIWRVVVDNDNVKLSCL